MAEPVIGGYRLQPGADGTDLTLLLVPVPGQGPEEVRDAAERAARRLMGGAGDRVRRGIQVAVAELAASPEAAGPEAAGPEATGPEDNPRGRHRRWRCGVITSGRFVGGSASCFAG